MKITTVTAAVALAASSTSAFAMGGFEPTSIWIHPKAPTVEVTDFGGIATENAFYEGRVTENSKKDWCENWRPGAEDCVETFGSDYDRNYKVTANCQTGELSDPYDNHYKFSGIFLGDELFDPSFEFINLKTGKVVQQNNADGGRVLAGFWADLCPLGAPYDILPLEPVIDYRKDFPELRKGPNYTVAANHSVHNGSLMNFDGSLGLITYIDPKNKSIAEHTVLFRGQIHIGGLIHGMAYTFKKGCDPAPYYVGGEGAGESKSDGSVKLTLTGKAPIRKGCEVIGYTEDSPNAKLEFVFFD